MLLQSKDVNTPGSSTITLFPFPPTQNTRLSENRNASYILVIFSFFLGNGSKMLIETFSRGGILKMPPSSAEVGRNSIPSVIVSLGIPEGREKRTRFKMMTPMREFEGGGERSGRKV